jgi:hypothetical protein
MEDKMVAHYGCWAEGTSTILLINIGLIVTLVITVTVYGLMLIVM